MARSTFLEFLGMSLLLGFSYQYVFPLHTGSIMSWVGVGGWSLVALATVVGRFLDIEFSLRVGEEE